MTAAAAPLVDWSLIDTCVLDMDGTLLDLNFDQQVWHENLPLHVARRTELDHASAVAHVRATLMEAHGTLDWYCLEHWSRVFGVDMASVEGELEHLIAMRSDAEHFLDFARARGLRLMLATNAHPHSLARKLEITGIDAWFDEIVSAHEIGHAKEHAGFWRAFAARVGLEPRTTLFIDDNHAVLEAARRFGVRYVFGIAYPSSRGERISHDDFHCLEHFDEVIGAASA
ncbi:MAG: GMP/IMP nucleotidase [Gammaproteobacteria bacterium]